APPWRNCGPRAKGRKRPPTSRPSWSMSPARWTMPPASCGRPTPAGLCPGWGSASPTPPTTRRRRGPGRRAAPRARALSVPQPRREIARRLRKGDSVVWVLLEGDAAKTEDETPELLSGELKTVEKTLKLPDGVGEGESRLLSALPLRIAFSVLRVARADPAERMFVAMLLGSQPEEAKGSGPLVFPVFGRGRVLTALTFDALKEGAVKDTASFLCGDCSCLVKRLNPGTDLL